MSWRALFVKTAVAVSNATPSPEVGESSSGFLDQHDERGMVPRPALQVDRRLDSSFGNEKRAMSRDCRPRELARDMTDRLVPPTIEGARERQDAHFRLAIGCCGRDVQPVGVG